MYAQTSKLAFEKIRDYLPESRLLVYKALKKLKYGTNNMITKELDWTINRVTGRTNELKKMGLIRISHVSWCPITKSKCQYMTLTKF